MKKLFYACLISVLSLLLYCACQPYYVRGILIELSDYMEVAGGIYVDPATTKVQVDSLLEAIGIVYIPAMLGSSPLLVKT